MKYKAIITDIDGTAIPNGLNAHPTSRVVKAIQSAKKKGVYVSASTGRPLFIARDIIKELGITDPCAISDATQIFDPVLDVIVKSFPLDNRSVKAVKQHLLNRHIPFMIDIGEGEAWYKEGIDLPKKIHWIAVPELSMKNADVLITSLSEIQDVSIHKVISYTKNLYWVSVTSPIATKLHSVLAITGLLGVKPEETIGIGEGYNDFALLSACGLKIAMGNAVPELKAIADFIAPSVEEDGLATIIEKFILI